MPVPDPVGPGSENGRNHFQHSFGVNGASNHLSHPLTASKLVSNSLASQRCTETEFVANGSFWPPALKAIPLASYYKLHRVPSLTNMSEPVPDETQTVKLPRRESTTDAPDNLPQNGIHNKILEQVVRTPGREPSPQPTHLSVPGPGQHKVLHEKGSGYVAPKFEGKELQMDQGMIPC